MKIIVTHNYPDWDAITSVWLLKRYLPEWEDAEVEFVPHGSRITVGKEPSISDVVIGDQDFELSTDEEENAVTEANAPAIEMIESDEVIHVDTGYGALDHHQSEDENICATSLVFEFLKSRNENFEGREDKWIVKLDALQRIVHYNIDLDHFQEVYWPDSAADRYEFGFFGLLEGYKAEVHDNQKSLDFGMTLLDAVLHRLEIRVWAEREIQKKANIYNTQLGKVMGIETLNDEVIKLAQRMGYIIVVRKDPKRGHVRIKALPVRTAADTKLGKDGRTELENLDLTSLYERLKKADPRATWFLHSSKRMILNSGSKLNGSVQTTLPLDSVMQIILELYR